MILRKRYFFIFLTITLIFISGCGMPNIVVLRDPLTAEEHLHLGLSYEKKHLFEEAIKHYKEASKNDARGFLLMGNLYLHQGEYNKAEESYRKAIKRDSKLADAYNNLAWLYCLRGEKLDEAETLIRKALEIEKENHDKIKNYEDTLQKINRLKNK